MEKNGCWPQFTLIFLFSHVPSGWLAAFAKRLVQLSLTGTAPLALLLPLLTVAANVLINHPACRVLIDRRSKQNVSVSQPSAYVYIKEST